ncbi:MAG TPA: DUF3298 domain-containing protein [Chitinophaga sp.]|uniref:DUF3298 and DUF4163 domain-containing protein n=1 Tax=Chitinophaga sp. TaxID=1869181 RepID=UPI002C8CAE61|nr:DUF3298 domain-containing protein [Chitinophaga sp.]HVI47704.1 DUF3298 domain-containing protein [Chitinophaga sp.]
MKKTFLSFLLATAALFSCHTNSTPAKAGSDTAILVIPLASTPYFYTQLKGVVGGKHITMQLLKTAPHLFGGYYCYDSIGQPVNIWGSLDSNLVKLYEETTAGGEERFFGGTLSDDGIFKGVWHGDSTSHHFELHTDLRRAVPFRVYYDTDSLHLIASNPQSPIGMVSSSIIWPDSSVDSSLATFLKRQITSSTYVTTPEQYIKMDMDSFKISYQVAAKDADSSELNDETQANSWNWTTDDAMRIVWNTWPYLVIEKYSYDFTGGAHGNWNAVYITLDLSKKKVITPADIFKTGYKEKLSPLLDKAFRKKYKIGEDEMLYQNLLVKTIPANDNLIVTDKGVAFSYVPYEIGPYALGQVTLFIPFTELKPLLKN